MPLTERWRSTRASPAGGMSAAFSESGSVNTILRSSMSRPHFCLAHAKRIGTPLSAMGMAYFFKRRFDEAAAKLLLSIQDHPGFPPAYRTPASCYAHIWGCSTKLMQSPHSCAPSPLKSYQSICRGAIPRTASYCSLVSDWQPARRRDKPPWFFAWALGCHFAGGLLTVADEAVCPDTGFPHHQTGVLARRCQYHRDVACALETMQADTS